MPVSEGSAAESSRDTQEQFKTQLTRFDVAQAQCTKDDDTQRLLSCIVSLHPLGFPQIVL